MFTLSALTGGNPKVPSSLNIPGDLNRWIFSTASGLFQDPPEKGMHYKQNVFNLNIDLKLIFE